MFFGGSAEAILWKKCWSFLTHKIYWFDAASKKKEKKNWKQILFPYKTKK